MSPCEVFLNVLLELNTLLLVGVVNLEKLELYPLFEFDVMILRPTIW
jgi:hypothetical protein